MNDKLKYIADTLGTEEILIQLGEEASELSQAALKLRRCINGKNPTPKTYNECIENIFEEISDVDICIVTLMELLPEEKVVNTIINEVRIRNDKINRWVERLRAKNA